MVCPKCKNSAVLNEVLGKEFYYCRTCKDEVQLQSQQVILNHVAKALELVQSPGVLIGITSSPLPTWSGIGPQAPQNPQNVPTPFGILEMSHDWSPLSDLCRHCGVSFLGFMSNPRYCSAANVKGPQP